MANRTLKLVFISTMLFTLLTANLAQAETVIDIYVGDTVTTIIDDNDPTSGYHYESTIGIDGSSSEEASRTIDLWTEGDEVDKFAVSDQWKGVVGNVEIDTFFENDGYIVDFYVSATGGWVSGFQTVSNGFGADDSDLWIDNTFFIADCNVPAQLISDSEYISKGNWRRARADFDVQIETEKLWYSSTSTYTDNRGGQDYMSAHVWGPYSMNFGLDDLLGPKGNKDEDYSFEFAAGASDVSSEAYIRFYDFAVTAKSGGSQDYFSIYLDTFWSNWYGYPEALIEAHGDHALEGSITTSIGPPPPFMVVNGWLTGW